MDEPEGKTRWHRILGKLFELLFAATDVTVKTDFPLMSDPPRADIMLLRRNTPHWTVAHKAHLPDGVRDSLASHILLEFKYTESLNQRRIEKVHGYDILYRETQGLADDEVASFILSSKTPRQSLLDAYGYQPTEWPGVYRSEQVMVNRVGLLVLNELRPVPHNAYIKCFASRQKAKEAAFELLGQLGFERLPRGIFSFVAGLRRLVLPQGGNEDMLNIEITPEDVMALGKEWQAAILASIPVEERLLGLKPEERLVGLKPEERLLGLKPEERLLGLKPEERLLGLKPEDVLSQYKPEVVLSQYEPYLEEREQQAEYKTMLKTVRQTLRIRFKLSDEQLDKVENQLRNVDLFALEGLSETALLVEAWADFDAKLQAILPPDKPSEFSEPHRT